MTARSPKQKTIVAVDDDRFELDGDASVPALRDAIEAAVASGGTFVDIAVTHGNSVAVLITPRTRVVISSIHEIDPEPEPLSYPSGLHIIDDI
ncbi:hypothetical protein KZX37_14145 [Microbacterium sp. EYE_5]|uniref:hypothetical protein n=1 Tax=unclassified Microbacterium TaxID=2609290 RepID=UPI002002B5D7|nr:MULTISPECIES: hypothetical protein [unclassified Microbacterium]MCK6081755.1 hypothetical protein [Microbacterium sp. EYE_382]MCK6087025.1 hypothetical protein [Microbacterium sp. EYE_384]MCK6124997.1 hypothetical protein [Microbacterium sp. EYE_80]MCK6127788.1 hypothetical protein [Microbacterium sp. EYE_79]MCK6142709.1 hypothetical protein [Microbacterium sp. EYE_39]